MYSEAANMMSRRIVAAAVLKAASSSRSPVSEAQLTAKSGQREGGLTSMRSTGRQWQEAYNARRAAQLVHELVPAARRADHGRLEQVRRSPRSRAPAAPSSSRQLRRLMLASTSTADGSPPTCASHVLGCNRQHGGCRRQQGTHAPLAQLTTSHKASQ